jgi:hypothetical protein
MSWRFGLLGERLSVGNVGKTGTHGDPAWQNDQLPRLIEILAALVGVQLLKLLHKNQHIYN